MGIPGDQCFDWTAASDALLVKRVREGASLSKIAAEIGCTRNAVVGKKWRLGLTDPNAVFWTYERECQIRQFVKEGASSIKAGAFFDVNPARLRRKAKRMGLKFSDDGVGKARPRRSARRLSNEQRAEIAKGNYLKPLELPTQNPSEIPMEQRKAFLQLTSNDCRYPYGHVGDEGFFFCGAIKTSGSSYCEHHDRICRGH